MTVRDGLRRPREYGQNPTHADHTWTRRLETLFGGLILPLASGR